MSSLRTSRRPLLHTTAAHTNCDLGYVSVRVFPEFRAASLLQTATANAHYDQGTANHLITAFAVYFLWSALLGRVPNGTGLRRKTLATARVSWFYRLDIHPDAQPMV